MKFIFSFLFLFSVLIFFPCLAAEQTITEKNQINHPSILEIRSIYDDIEKQIKEKNYSMLSFNTRGINYAIFRDKKLKVRLISSVSASGGSASINQVYYDSEGYLVFILFTFESDGIKDVTRYYFSKNELIYPISQNARKAAMEELDRFRAPDQFLFNEIISLEKSVNSLAYDINSLKTNSQSATNIDRVESAINKIKSLNKEIETLFNERESLQKHLSDRGNRQKSTNAQHDAASDANSARR